MRFDRALAVVLFFVAAGWSCEAYASASAWSYLYSWIGGYEGAEPYLDTYNWQAGAYLQDDALYGDEQFSPDGTDPYVEGNWGGYAAVYMSSPDEPEVEAYVQPPVGLYSQATAQGLGEAVFQVFGTPDGLGGDLTFYVDYETWLECYTENPGEWANAGTGLSVILTNTTAGGDPASSAIEFSLAAADGEQSDWGDASYDNGEPLQVSLFFNEGDWGTLRIEAYSLAEAGATVTPAPGAVVLGSLGLGLVGWLRRRRAL